MYSLFYFLFFPVLFRVVEVEFVGGQYTVAVVQLLSFFTYYRFLFFLFFFFPPCCSCESATGLLSCLTINDAYRCTSGPFHRPVSSSPQQQQGPHNHWRIRTMTLSSLSTTRRVLNCRQAQLLFSLSLTCTIVCWPVAAPYISVNLSSFLIPKERVKKKKKKNRKNKKSLSLSLV